MIGGIMRFGKIIQQKRTEKGLSLRELAAECSISPTYLSDLEKGKTDTYAEGIIYKLAEELDLDGDELIIAKGKCPRWVQEFVVEHWEFTKIFIAANPKKKKKT